MNKVIILGRLGQEPEMKHTPSGVAVCNLSLATSEKFKDKAGVQQEKTEWHRIVLWSKLAELANQYLKKGSQVVIEGKLATRSWEDKEGNKRYTTEVVGSNMQFIGGSDTSQGSAQPKNNEPAKEYNVSTDANFASDDIPF